jgi:hypothetical protein
MFNILLMSSVIILRAVRAHFGLSQQELGQWLGLSRSLLARVETDRDQLPGHAQPWLKPWVDARVRLPTPAEATPVPASAQPLPAGTGPLLARWHECQYQAQRLQIQLAALQVRSGYLRARLAAAPYLQAALPPAAPNEPVHTALALRRRWLSRLLEAATDGLNPNLTGSSPTAETLLAARRSAWLHEAAFLEASLAGTE